MRKKKQEPIKFASIIHNLEFEKYKRFFLCRIKCTEFAVIKEDNSQVEVSFSRTWDSKLTGKQIPLKIDER